jgi:hypothetical protein
MVEYEERIVDLIIGKTIQNLCVNPDNTINIQPIKTNWSREEVTELVLKAYNAGWNNYCDMIQGRCTGIYSKEFIEENL